MLKEIFENLREGESVEISRAPASFEVHVRFDIKEPGAIYSRSVVFSERHVKNATEHADDQCWMQLERLRAERKHSSGQAASRNVPDLIKHVETYLRCQRLEYSSNVEAIRDAWLRAKYEARSTLMIAKSSERARIAVDVLREMIPSSHVMNFSLIRKTMEFRFAGTQVRIRFFSATEDVNKLRGVEFDVFSVLS